MRVEREPRTSLQPSASFILEDQVKMAEARNYFAWQGRLVVRELGQRVVEVGCGIGNFTGLLLGREVVIALDSEARCVEQLRVRYPDQRNLHTFCRDVNDNAFGEVAGFRPD